MKKKINDLFVVFHEDGLLPAKFDGYFGVLIYFNSGSNQESLRLHIFKNLLDSKRFFVKKFGKVSCSLCVLKDNYIDVEL